MVISGYSSTNYFAMMAGIVGVVYADVPKLTARFHQDKNVDVVPEVCYTIPRLLCYALRRGWEATDFNCP